MSTSALETTIQKQTLIHAPRARVWHALTNPAQFAQWFGAEFTGSFQPGVRLEMVSTGQCSSGDGSSDQPFFILVDRLEPEHFFSWSWSPGSALPGQEITRVEFRLEEVDGGTLVSVTESGFDQISLARRAKAFEENSSGWQHQLHSLAQHVNTTA